MKRTLSFGPGRATGLVWAGCGLVAATYGLVRLAYGLFLPDVQESLGLTSGLAGYVASAASAAYCVGALAGLLVAGRPRLLVLAAVGTASVGAAGMALAPGLAVFVPAAVLSSAGAGLASPALVDLVERAVALDRRAGAQSVVNAGTGPGLVAAGLLALLLLPQWRLGLAVGAVVTVLTGCAVLALDDRSAPVRGSGAVVVPWRALRVPAAGAVLLGAASATVWTYGRTLLVDEGAGASASVGAWIALGVGGTLTVLSAGRLGRLPPARAWLVTVVVVAASIAVLGLAAGHLPVAVLACGLFGWGFVAASSALISWAAQAGPGAAAAGTSVLFVLLVVGQGVGAAVAGALGEGLGLPVAFVVAAGLASLAAACGFVGGVGEVHRPEAQAVSSRDAGRRATTS